MSLYDVGSSKVKRTRTPFCLSSSLGPTELDRVPPSLRMSPWTFAGEMLCSSGIQAVTKEKRLKGRSAYCLHLLDERKGCANEARQWGQLLNKLRKRETEEDRDSQSLLDHG